MRDKITLAATLTALLFTTLATVPAAAAATVETPAVAVPALTPVDTITWWSGPFFSGHAMFTPEPPADVCWELHLPWASVENDTSSTLQIFTDSYCTIPLVRPTAGLVPPHDDAPRLTPTPASYMVCGRTICKPSP